MPLSMIETTDDGHCADCDDLCDSSDTIDVDGRVLCLECAREAGWDRCTRCHEETNDPVSNDEGTCYCSSCYEELYTHCVACNEEVGQRDHFHNNDGDDYCETCYRELYTSCDTCGAELGRDDACSTDDGTYCESCYEERNDSSSGSGWEHGYFQAGALYKEIRSRRAFGVELETASCAGFRDLDGHTPFDCRGDGSISGKEFTSPVLSSDKGLEVIRDFCEFANDHNFTVDNHCGFHAHFDVRDLSAEEKQSVAYAYLLTYEVWAAFVNSTRRGNSYCKRATWDRETLERLIDRAAWREFSYDTDRYVWMNLSSFSKHTTFEVRLHTATLDAKKVCNWVKAHARFIDWAASKGLDELEDCFAGSVKAQFKVIATIWADTDLADFYAERARRFGTVLVSKKKLQPVQI